MSDIGSNDYQDITVQAIEDYLGDTLTLEDLVEMSEEERQAYFSAQFTQLGFDDSTIDEFIDALDAEMENWEWYIADQYSTLQDILDSGIELTSSEANSIERIMAELLEIQEMCSGDLVDDVEAGESIYNDHYITAEDDDYIEHSADDPQDGDVYNIDATADGDEDSSGITFDYVDPDNPDAYMDQDDDGIIDPDEYIYDEDGHVNYDVNEDGEINELDDPAFSDGTNGTTVVLDIPEDATVYIMDYDPDAEPVSMRIKVTLDDGTVYYYNITGTPKIVMPIPVNYESIPEDLALRLYAGTDQEHSYAYSLYGHDANVDESYYTMITMDDEENEYEIAPDPQDFEDGREYIVEFDSNSYDELNIDAEDCIITFEVDPNGNPVLVLTNEDGDSVRIVCKGLEIAGEMGGAFADEHNGDVINIEGGTFDYDSYSELDAYAVTSLSDSLLHTFGGLFYMIFHDEERLCDEATSDGYVITGRSIMA